MNETIHHFVLVYRGADGYIQINKSKGLCKETSAWPVYPKRRYWQLVTAIQNATIFTDGRICEQAKEHFCRLPWIHYRPITNEERTIYDNSQPRPKSPKTSR